MKQGSFETKRLILRPLRKADYAAWFEAYVECGPALSKWDHGPCSEKQGKRKSFEDMLDRHKKLARDDEYYRYGVFIAKTGAFVGEVDFSIFYRATHQFANFGFLIHNQYWRQGYGREAAAAGLRIGFGQLKLNRLEAALNLDNRKSMRLCKAIGMRREGIKRRYWFEHGQWVDHLIYVANPEDIGLKPVKPF